MWWSPFRRGPAAGCSPVTRNLCRSVRRWKTLGYGRVDSGAGGAVVPRSIMNEEASVVEDLFEDRLSGRLVEEGGSVVLTVDDIALEARRDP